MIDACDFASKKIFVSRNNRCRFLCDREGPFRNNENLTPPLGGEHEAFKNIGCEGVNKSPPEESGRRC